MLDTGNRCVDVRVQTAVGKPRAHMRHVTDHHQAVYDKTRDVRTNLPLRHVRETAVAVENQ